MSTVMHRFGRGRRSGLAADREDDALAREANGVWRGLDEHERARLRRNPPRPSHPDPSLPDDPSGGGRSRPDGDVPTALPIVTVLSGVRA
jgi:hypothetical protein